MTVATDPRKTGINAGATLLAASAVASPITGTTSETALATVSIPAGAMGLNGAIEVRTVWSVTNSANNKVMRVRFGGIAGTAFLQLTVTTSATFGDERRIRNRGSASSQVGSSPLASVSYGTSTAAMPTGAIDTTASVDLVITGTLVNTGETITLESYEVWLLP